MENKQFTKKQKDLILKIYQGKEKGLKTWVDEWWLLKEGIKYDWLTIMGNKVTYKGYETTNLK